MGADGKSGDTTALVIGLGLVAVIAALRILKGPAPPVNPGVKKDCAKCVDILKVPDLEELKKADGKLVFCRCWRSKTFPYCDGTHSKYNEESGDNVGPLIIKAA
mmetsp:Transcript_86552/g.242402  ORF Transcript_86552/g.242402 Transcript_86552/m.242402 type:complete len:104 (-) Transcript_86552:91-402(-)